MRQFLVKKYAATLWNKAGDFKQATGTRKTLGNSI